LSVVQSSKWGSSHLGRAIIARRARKLREHLHAILAAGHVGQSVPKASLNAIASKVRWAHAARALVTTPPTSAVKHGWLSPSAPEMPLYAFNPLEFSHSLVTKRTLGLRAARSWFWQGD